MNSLPPQVSIFPCFRNSGNVEVCRIGLETVTLFRFRPPDQVQHRQASPNEQSASSEGTSKDYWSVSVLENDWNYWNDGTIGTGFSGVRMRCNEKIITL
jgi:hypothetical protein